MRDPKDMHWFLWEAIVMQARDMRSKGLVTDMVMCDIDFITGAVKRSGVFSERMRLFACQIEVAISDKEAEWLELVEKEVIDALEVR